MQYSIPAKKWPLFFLALIANAMWALSYPISKIVLETMPAEQLTWLRLLYSSVFMLPLIRLSQVPRPFLKIDIFLLALMGALGVAGASALQFWGTHLTLASHVSLLVGLEPPMIAIFSLFIFKSKLNWKQFSGILLAFVGAVGATIDWQQLIHWEGDIIKGDILILLSVCCYCGYTLIGKYLSARWETMLLTAIPFIMATIVWGIGLCFGDRSLYEWSFPETAFIGKILFLTVGATSFCYYIWNWLVARLDVNWLGFSLYIQLILGGAFSAILIGDQLGAMYWIGLIAVVLGSVLLNSDKS